MPWGVTAIEASAGTGKTYTLARLVARYVAEADIKIDQILVVTFTRAAAAELRERIRGHLVESIAELAPGVPRSRLETALSDFDSATITTIHGFAQQILATLGSGAPGNPNARLINDTTELVASVASNQLAALSLTLAGHPGEDPLIHQAIAATEDPADLLPGLSDITGPAQIVLNNPGLRLEPAFSTSDPDWPMEVRRHLIEKVTANVLARRQSRGTMAFDDMLSQLASVVVGGNSNARTMLANRFPVALIDEFQDTDQIQWDIFSAVFGRTEGTSLVLVGDPKQAIYSFRGASITTYTAAVTAPGARRFSLPTNWRSSGAAIEALDHLLTGTTFGPSVTFARVEATAEHRDDQILIKGAPAAGLHIRRSGPETWGAAKPTKKTPKPPLKADSARSLIRSDLVNEILSLLEHAEIPDGSGGYRPLQPNDIAVLTNTNKFAEADKDALVAAGVPAVVLKGDDVFATEAASQWRLLLNAVASPENGQRARAAALGWFFGWSYEKLDQASDSAVAKLQADLKAWADALDTRGPAHFFTTAVAQSGVVALTMSETHGERNLTDILHLSEILQGEADGKRVGASGLIELMDRLSAEYSAEDSDKAQRRVETDAEAVSVLTMHSAKGLEFPVVCCPSLSEGESKPHTKDVLYSDGAARVLDLRGNTNNGGTPQDRKDRAAAERRAEKLRLAYVALTRAKYRTVCWWANTRDADTSPLASLLFARTADGTIDEAVYEDLTTPTAGADEWMDKASPLLDRAGGTITTGEMPSEPLAPLSRYQARSETPADELAVRSLDRELDRVPERWSFSLITNRAAAAHASDLLDDEPPAPPTPTSAEPGDLVWGDVPGSAAFGTLVHQIYEEVDFASPDLTAEVGAWVAELGRAAVWPASEEVITRGIVDSIRTPLGSGLDLCLADLERRHRLDELNFELNLGEAGHRATGSDIGDLILSHLPPDHALVGWARSIEDGAFDVELAGHMTGSIDLVMRLADGRYVIADYKTNKLGRPGQAATAQDYQPERLPDAMAHHHYPLQGLLYGVALHRFLRWRLSGYSPERHLGGMAYLFVRGMSGPKTTPGQGVFFWRAPPDLVTGLSDLLHGVKP